MGILRAVLSELIKMFVADLALTLTALLAVAAIAAALAFGVVDRTIAPFLLAAGVFAALAIGVARGAGR